MKTANDSLASVSWVEHQTLEHIKEALRVTLDWNAPAVSLQRKRSSVRFTLQSFFRHLERVMSIEEMDGYLDRVVEQKPNLHVRIQRLSRDHQQFRTRVAQLAPLLDSLNEWQDADFDEACHEIRDLLDAVDRHDHEEVRLLQEALSTDEGGEG
ncbi:MAG: hemerythrin domain-containing protein [Planctomycetota bacterium]